MKEFDQQLLRLKQVLNTTEDQEVAQLLGLSKAAFAQRKARGAFPSEKLALLAQTRPELQIDITFVLKGQAVASAAAAAASTVLHSYRRDQAIEPLPAAMQEPPAQPPGQRNVSAEEARILDALRDCAPADRAAVTHLVERLADRGLRKTR